MSRLYLQVFMVSTLSMRDDPSELARHPLPARGGNLLLHELRLGTWLCTSCPFSGQLSLSCVLAKGE